MNDHAVLLAERLENVSRAIDKVYEAVKRFREDNNPENKTQNEETIAIYERYLAKLKALQTKLMIESSEPVYD